MFVLQVHRSFAAMQKVEVIRSNRSDIKAEKKDKEITKGFYCSILNFGCQSVIMIFIFSSLQVYNKSYKKKQLSPVSTVSCLIHTLSTFFHQNLKRHARECNSSLDQDQDRSISSSIASCQHLKCSYSAKEFQHNAIC